MKIFFPVVLIIILLSACSKSDTSQQAIDVSSQQYTDALGNELMAVGTGPSSGNTFTTKEMALFNSFDTVSSSTTVPAGVDFIAVYPNPSYSSGTINIFNKFTGFSGTAIERIVITDSLLNPVYKVAIGVHGPALSESLMAAIPKGRYRMYITLSAYLNNNFYTQWIKY